MSFKFHCSNCGQKLEAEDHHIGSNLNCPGCSQPLEIPKPTNIGNSNPPPLDGVKWHYELDGQAIGPVSENDIQRLVAARKITSFTRVWTKGMAGWVNAGDSTLKGLFVQTGSYSAATEQIKAVADNLQKEWTKASRDLSEKSSPFIKKHVVPRLKTPRYIILIICSLTFLYQCQKQETIDAHIQYLESRSSDVNNNTFWHSAGTFFGIFSGDPTTAMAQGYKLGEDLQNSSALSDQKERLKGESTEASLWAILAFIIGFFAAARIAFKHWRNKGKGSHSVASKS